jgi:nitrate reductase alpha subunit
MGFLFGADGDSPAITTVPKETLIRISKAEDGGIGGVGAWEPGTRGFGPAADTPQNLQHLTGRFVSVID